MNVDTYRAQLTAAVRRWFHAAKVGVTTHADTLTVTLIIARRTPPAGLVRRIPLIGAPDVVEARARHVAEELLEQVGANRLVLRERARSRFTAGQCPDVILVDRRGCVTAEREHQLLDTRSSLDEYLRAYRLDEADLTPA